MSEMAFFRSAGPYNQATTATPLICHLGKISYFISPEEERGYGDSRECRPVSMPVGALQRAATDPPFSTTDLLRQHGAKE